MKFLAAAATLALAGPAAALPQTCFLKSNINGFSAPNDRTVYVRVGVSDYYRLDLMTECTGLTFRQAIGLKSTRGSAWICSPLDATVVYHQTGMRQSCPVIGIHKLTPAEFEALPKRDRP